MALELAILIPVVIAMLLVVAALGRVTHGRQLVDDAAAAGSRAAALSTSPGQAEQRARASITEALAQAGVSCQNPRIDVDTTAFTPGGQVAVVLTCTSDLSQMGLIGLPGQMSLTATARTPIETYRDLSGGESP
jgi:Flp pilus assembly protein TadG